MCSCVRYDLQAWPLIRVAYLPSLFVNLFYCIINTMGQHGVHIITSIALVAFASVWLIHVLSPRGQSNIADSNAFAWFGCDCALLVFVWHIWIWICDGLFMRGCSTSVTRSVSSGCSEAGGASYVFCWSLIVQSSHKGPFALSQSLKRIHWHLHQVCGVSLN